MTKVEEEEDVEEHTRARHTIVCAAHINTIPFFSFLSVVVFFDDLFFSFPPPTPTPTPLLSVVVDDVVFGSVCICPPVTVHSHRLLSVYETARRQWQQIVVA